MISLDIIIKLLYNYFGYKEIKMQKDFKDRYNEYKGVDYNDDKNFDVSLKVYELTTDFESRLPPGLLKRFQRLKKYIDKIIN